MLVKWISATKDVQLHEQIIEGWLNIFMQHIKNYKELRAEIDAHEPLKTTKKPRHIDDFNEYNYVSEDDSTQWSLKLDKINNEIVNRMKAKGSLHEAAGRNKLAEQEYIRKLSNQIISLIDKNMDKKNNIGINDKKCGTESKILKTLIREWIVCKITWPIFHHFWTPDYLNQMILEQVHKTKH